MDVYLSGKRVHVRPAASLGKGGEADVYAIGRGRALKVFKGPDHPDVVGSRADQDAARARLELLQEKLPAFPGGLPDEVVRPEELATDRTGRRILGYAMRRVEPAVPLVRLADPAHRRAGIPSSQVVELLRTVRRTLVRLHDAGVVVGDLNDLNLLESGGRVHFIDADSYQYGGHPCTVFTERFVDPRLCDPGAVHPILKLGYDRDADWYAFTVLVMQSLLLVGPHGGVYRPRRASQRVAHPARPLWRITVFHPEVVYPRPARRPESLPDELVDHLRAVFEEDRRGEFPVALLDELVFSRCARCGAEHARLSCPFCRVAPAGARQGVVSMRGQVGRRVLVTTDGVILGAAIQGGHLRYLHYEDGVYRREHGRALFESPLDPDLGLHLQGEATWVTRGRELVVLGPEGERARHQVDLDGAGRAAVATRGDGGVFARGGRLLAVGGQAADATGARAGGPRSLGEVLEDQTRLWPGPTAGLGLYRAGALSVAFLFDPRREGIRDDLELPRLSGQLVEAQATLDERRAWLMLALAHRGRTRHLCLVYGPEGALEATAEARAGDGSWLGTLGGHLALGGALLAPTDEGLVRVEVDGGAARVVREFPDTLDFLDSSSRLLAGSAGLHVVGAREISVLTMGARSR